MTPAISPTRLSYRKATEWICIRCQSQGWKLLHHAYSTTSTPTERPFYDGPPPDVRRPQKLSDTIKAGIPEKKLRLKRQPVLPRQPARTRFAPSPTGYLHIGGLRTALFSYLLAQRTGGQFLLRIEDTDQKRLVPGAETKLFEDLRWAGLDWDEGPEVGGPHGPYRQSERNDIYQSHARHLLDRGSAYRCFCPAHVTGTEPKAAFVTSGCYGNCSSLSPDESISRAERGTEAFTVRLREPKNAHRKKYPDLVYGNIQRLKRSPSATSANVGSGDDTVAATAVLADTILMKSDGTPTYHFANVVDDHLMRITHVIRGAEWMASTPLHYDIYEAFNWTPPHFAHVPLLVDESGAKLSKRNQDLNLDVASMRDKEGILPFSLNNFLALLGWSNPTSNDVMSMDMLSDLFDLKFTRGNTTVSMQKLVYLQKRHVSCRVQHCVDTGSTGALRDVLRLTEEAVRGTYDNPYAGRYVTEQYDHSEFNSPLEAYLTEVLLTFGKGRTTWDNPTQWVQRYSYLFTQHGDTSPDLPKRYFDGSGKYSTDVDSVRKFMQTWADTFQWDSSEHATALSDQTTLGNDHNHASWPTRDLVDRTNLHMYRLRWAATLSEFPLATEPDAAQLPAFSPQEYSEDVIEKCTHYGVSPSDVAHDIAAFILQKQHSASPAGSSEDDANAVDALAAAIAAKYKAITEITSAFCRAGLAYGAEGPAVNMVMALLGEKEVRVRLGLNAKP